MSVMCIFAVIYIKGLTGCGLCPADQGAAQEPESLSGNEEVAGEGLHV